MLKTPLPSLAWDHPPCSTATMLLQCRPLQDSRWGNCLIVYKVPVVSAFLNLHFQFLCRNQRPRTHAWQNCRDLWRWVWCNDQYMPCLCMYISGGVNPWFYLCWVTGNCAPTPVVVSEYDKKIFVLDMRRASEKLNMWLPCIFYVWNQLFVLCTWDV
jgi:hypothetical protein